jgi:hypothetical protein
LKFQIKAEAPEWPEVMVNGNIDIFEISYEEFMSFFKRLENLEKIRRTNSPNPSSPSVEYETEKLLSCGVGRSSKNLKGSNMWCHYFDKNNHKTTVKHYKSRKRLALKPKLDPERNLWPSFSKKLMHSKGR